MASIIPTRKFYVIAILSSILIGTLSIATHAILHPISIAESSKIGFLLTLIVFIFWLINITLIYSSRKYFNNKFPTYIRYILSYIICFTLVVITRFLLMPSNSSNESTDNFILHNSGISFGRGFAIFILGIAFNAIVLLILDLILLRDKKTLFELENAELKIKNVEATNQKLKQQIHPHFLFNSLNTLKTLINKNSDQAEDYLIKLSDFLRVSISSDIPNIVKLSDEIKICQDYLEMQKMRFGEVLQYTINIPKEIQNSKFVPIFSLLPLLENAIKHNKLTTDLPLKIQIEYSKGSIITTNNIEPKLSSEPSTGLGLKNLAERYKILTGNEIIVNNRNNVFTVNVKTLDNEDSNYRR